MFLIVDGCNLPRIRRTMQVGKWAFFALLSDNMGKN